jgi:threonine/homoserine/homoserine lactone efflux protein
MGVTMTMAATASSIVAETTIVTAVGHNNGAVGMMMAVGVGVSAVISLQPTVL